MFLTIISGECITCLEVSPDLELENFIALCCIEIPHLASTSRFDLRLIMNGVSVIPNSSILHKHLEVLFWCFKTILYKLFSLLV